MDILQRIPDAELDVMLILWKNGRSMRVSEIYDELKTKRRCSKPSVHTLISRLEGRGFLCQQTVDAPNPYKLITPLVKEKDYAAGESDVLVGKLYGGSWKNLIVSLISDGKLDKKDIDELADILKKGGAK